MSDLTETNLATGGPTTRSGVNGHRASIENLRADFVAAAGVDGQATAAARWAVAEYLRDLGIRDPELIARESQRLVAEAESQLSATEKRDAQALSRAAIAATVSRIDQWLVALASASPDPDDDRELGYVAGARLPDLLSRSPEILKSERLPRELIATAGETLTPVVPPPRPRPMRRQDIPLVTRGVRKVLKVLKGLSAGSSESQEQSVDGSITPPPRSHGGDTTVRIWLAGLTIVCTLMAAWQYARVLWHDGAGLMTIPLTALFTILFVWVVFSFWMATFGLVVLLRRTSRLGQAASTDSENSSAQKPGPGESKSRLPSTAIAMPIYNEDPHSVFANLRAIAEELRALGVDESFSLYALSDSTNPDVWLEEERTWARLVAELPPSIRLFYRHRPKNVSRKAGNIADFCTRWGAHHEYVIVLDADSVMGGATLVEMVRRMERDPHVGILQAPPRPVNRQSVFARMQQFAAATYGPVFLEGFALWSQCDGNYWGHNAIIRIRPFMEHCELPVIPGDGPLSGEILSHDFVEAALMRRAGYKVCLAHDLDQSYEECPTTLLDFAQRDQRWCQGNLQHVRLLLAEGLHPASRFHLGMGAMSYLASPLWFAFLVLTIVGAAWRSPAAADSHEPIGGLVMFVVTMSLLLLPKVWGIIAAAASRQTAAGVGRTVASGLLETLASMFVAPVMMLLHSEFVVSTLLGRKVTWSAQQRDDCEVSFESAVAVHWPHTLAGFVLGAVVLIWAPDQFPWLSPIILGLVLSIPLAMLLGSARTGRWLRSLKLMLIPEEVSPPPILAAQHKAKSALGATPPPATGSLFSAVLWDPTFHALHDGILRATDGEVPLTPEQAQEADKLSDPAIIATAPPELRRALLGDRHRLAHLHVLTRCQPAARRTGVLT